MTWHRVLTPHKTTCSDSTSITTNTRPQHTPSRLPSPPFPLQLPLTPRPSALYLDFSINSPHFTHFHNSTPPLPPTPTQTHPQLTPPPFHTLQPLPHAVPPPVPHCARVGGFMVAPLCELLDKESGGGMLVWGGWGWYGGVWGDGNGCSDLFRHPIHHPRPPPPHTHTLIPPPHSLPHNPPAPPTRHPT